MDRNRFAPLLFITFLLFSLFSVAGKGMAGYPGECTYTWSDCSSSLINFSQYTDHNCGRTIIDSPPVIDENGILYYPGSTFYPYGTTCTYWYGPHKYCYVWHEYYENGVWYQQSLVGVSPHNGHYTTNPASWGFPTEDPSNAYPEGCPDPQLTIDINKNLGQQCQ